MNIVHLTIYRRQPNASDSIYRSYSSGFEGLENKSALELKNIFRTKTGIDHEMILQENIYVNGRALAYDDSYTKGRFDSLEYEAIIEKGNIIYKP